MRTSNQSDLPQKSAQKAHDTFAVLIFFHPDCNCWSRSFTESADARRQPVADFTASGELHPALKTKDSVVFLLVVYDIVCGFAIINFSGSAQFFVCKRRTDVL